MKKIIRYGLASLIFLAGFSNTFAQQMLRAQATVNGGWNMNIEVVVDVINDTVSLRLSGRDLNWFGYGFNGSAMNNTYAIITDGSGI